ncbi:MAG: MATE family efflux transporter [Arcanobacterium sp.]|nr:MATE family efflux transporter [Arcanobacterium sp.]
MAKKLTEGHEGKLILFFMLPLLLGNLFQQLYNMADTFIVGRYLGADALAAVGSVITLMFFVMGFAQAVTVGLTIPLAQRFGAGDNAGICRSFAVSIYISIAVSLIITVPSVIFSDNILRLMNTPENILADASTYLFVVFAGTIFTVAYNLLANVIRAIGDSRTPLYFLIIAATVNIVLDIYFIASLNMGVAGAALATIISQAFSAACCIFYIWKKIPILHLKRSDFRFDAVELREHLRLGIPMGFQMSIIAFGVIIIQIALNQHGSTAVAAYTVAQRIEQLALFPFLSFGIAAGVFVAQNYGAGKRERIWRGVRQTTLMSLFYGVVIGVSILLFAKQLISAFFGTEVSPELLQLGVKYLWLTVPFYPLLIFVFVYRNTIQALGETFIPTLAGIMEMIMRVLTAIFIAPIWGFDGIVVCHPLAWLGACIPLIWAYQRKKKELSAEF